MQKSRKHAVLFRCPERRRQCKEVGEQADKRAVFLAWYKFDFEKCKFLFVEIGTVPIFVPTCERGTGAGKFEGDLNRSIFPPRKIRPLGLILKMTCFLILQ